MGLAWGILTVTRCWAACAGKQVLLTCDAFRAAAVAVDRRLFDLSMWAADVPVQGHVVVLVASHTSLSGLLEVLWL